MSDVALAEQQASVQPLQELETQLHARNVDLELMAALAQERVTT
jgi:hypothetical protein